jgi:hypothetical protein
MNVLAVADWTTMYLHLSRWLFFFACGLIAVTPEYSQKKGDRLNDLLVSLHPQFHSLVELLPDDRCRSLSG